MRSLLASLGGGGVGIGLAVLGAGAWALVAQQLVAGAVSVVALWTLSPWRPSRSFSSAQFRELFPFGLNIVGSDLLTFLSRNGDNFLIGAVLGTTPLGFYAVGYRLLDVTQVLLINVARKISFPAFSRLQHDRERMVRAYLTVTRATSAIILPGYVGMALVALELVPVLFGGRWQASGQVAAVLFLIGPVLSLQAFSGSYLNAVGRPDVTLRFRLITTATNVAGFLIAVPFGIVAVAAAFVIRGYVLLPLNLYWMRVHGGVPPRAYLAQLKGTGFATLLMAMAVTGTRLLAGSALGPAALLAAQVVVGAVTYAAGMWLVDRRTVGELAELTGQALRGRRAAPQPPERVDPDGDLPPAG
jgi:O-antigen/teichoic acid export membrane protein